MILLGNAESKGQERDSSRVSHSYIRNCEFEHMQLEFVTSQRDSLATRPRITTKDKLIYMGIGGGLIMALLITLKTAIR